MLTRTLRPSYTSSRRSKAKPSLFFQKVWAGLPKSKNRKSVSRKPVTTVPKPRVSAKHSALPSTWHLDRQQWLLTLFLLIFSLFLGRTLYLQFLQKDFLQSQWDARHLRSLPIFAHRGMLLDRQGEPLAISTPVQSVWVNPTQFLTAQSQWPTLLNLLGLTAADLNKALEGRMQREFVYLKRHLSPTLATQVTQLNLPGVFLQTEYHRYYPTGELSSHLVGLTNIDDVGQEGMELALNPLLQGISGTKQVIQDTQGQILADLDSAQVPKAGQDIQLSIDRRLQYFAYRELKRTVLASQAKAGSAIILDVHTGEVLAMVNQPAYNPNNRPELHNDNYRNRAVTDLFEPGSTFKPFTIAAALESGQYTPASRIDTRPGNLQMGEYTISDPHNYGIINVTKVIQKSSNVGASKISLSLPRQSIWNLLNNLGFGNSTHSNFPGEASGRLSPFAQWQPVDQANLAYGYGVSVTLLQLVRAYAAIGNQGRLPTITFQKITNSPGATSQPIMRPQTAQQLLQMLHTVTQPGGTAPLANIPGFTVAGKTGTVRKYLDGKYSDTQYLALFVGLVPAESPRLAMAILIDEPVGNEYSGGEIAAPVFAKVMREGLRLLNINGK